MIIIYHESHRVERHSQVEIATVVTKAAAAAAAPPCGAAAVPGVTHTAAAAPDAAIDAGTAAGIASLVLVVILSDLHNQQRNAAFRL